MEQSQDSKNRPLCIQSTDIWQQLTQNCLKTNIRPRPAGINNLENYIKKKKNLFDIGLGIHFLDMTPRLFIIPPKCMFINDLGRSDLFYSMIFRMTSRVLDKLGWKCPK